MGNIKLMNLILNNMKKILEFIKKGWAWIATDGLLHFVFFCTLDIDCFPDYQVVGFAVCSSHWCAERSV